MIGKYCNNSNYIDHESYCISFFEVGLIPVRSAGAVTGGLAAGLVVVATLTLLRWPDRQFV